MKYLEVRNLFGQLNYRIDFMNSDVVIITGPNGYGKTMLLTIIDRIIMNDIESLLSINFQSIEAVLINDVSININREHNMCSLLMMNHNGDIIYSSGIQIDAISSIENEEYIDWSTDGGLFIPNEIYNR